MRYANNVRFWTFINGDRVKLTLRPGQVIEFNKVNETDEGYAAERDIWEYDAEEGIIRRTHESVGRDCDGRYEHHGEMFCLLADVRAGNEVDGIVYPAWEEGRCWNRDYTAEAAGY